MPYAPHGGLTGKARSTFRRERRLRQIAQAELEEFEIDNLPPAEDGIDSVPIRHRNEFLPSFAAELVALPDDEQPRQMQFAYEPSRERLRIEGEAVDSLVTDRTDADAAHAREDAAGESPRGNPPVIRLTRTARPHAPVLPAASEQRFSVAGLAVGALIGAAAVFGVAVVLRLMGVLSA